jgi:MYXO-CTERM domain-containing protein
VLAEDAPVAPIPFNVDPLGDEFVGERVVSVGYGITSGQTQAGSGIKRSARLIVSDVDGEFLVSASNENPNNANVCSGDSGGPQYHKLDDGRWEQVSVHSWADQNCLFLSGSTRTDLTSNWIMNRIEDVHGTDDYCDAAGFYDDDVCDAWCDADPACFDESNGPAACNSTQGAPLGFSALLGLLALGLRRRR